MNPDLRTCMMAIVRNPAWAAFTWLGMTIGVSLLATPARFSATVAGRPDILDVSRVVFAALNKAELIALALTLLLVRISGRARELWVPVLLLALILIAQGSWLIPELSARTDLIIAGSEPPPSVVHGVYSGLEIAKLTLLAFVGFRSMQCLMTASQQ